MKLAATLVGLLIATPLLAGGTSVTKRSAVSTSSRYATNAALGVLRSGGNAADAALAAAFVLSVASPHAAGLGGGGMLVYHERSKNATWVVDFREAAPAKLPIPPKEGLLTGVNAAATPGLVRGLAETHARFGSRPWKELLLPASRLAEEGVIVGGALSAAIERNLDSGRLDARTAAVLAPGGKAPAPGDRLVQKQLAITLAKISKGAAAMTDGALAIRISEASAKEGGALALRDFREYRAQVRAPLSVQAGPYSFVTAPPPSTGGFVLASTVAITSGLDLGREGAESVRFVHFVAEAARRAALDARRSVGDPAYTRVALDRVLASDRLRHWRESIDPARATPSGSLQSPDSPHTSHIAVVDSEGNVASMTISMSGEFGCGWMAADTGIILNGAMNDFRAKLETLDGETSAPIPPNAAEPKKRPASPVAPTIVLFDGKPRIAIGAAGGEAIASVVLTVLLRHISFGESLPDAVAAPRIFQTEAGDQLACERHRWPVTTLEALRSMGHGVAQRDSIGEINAILMSDSGLVAVADPRGEGATGGN